MAPHHRSKTFGNASAPGAQRSWRAWFDAMPIVILARAIRSARTTRPPSPPTSKVYTFSR